MAINKTKRPFNVTLVAFVVLIFSVWNGIKLSGVILFWPSLIEYRSSPGPLYNALTSAIWLVAGITLFWGLWSGWRRGRQAAIVVIAGYTLWYWLDRLVLQQGYQANWLFTLVSTAILLLVVLSVLLSRGASRFFRKESYEHKSKNQTPEGTKGEDEAGGRSGTS